MTEFFTLEYVAEMNFDNRQRECTQSIQDRDGSVRVRARIENKRGCRLPRFLNPADQFALVIRLAEIDLKTRNRGLLAQALLYGGQSLTAINLRLAFPD